MLLPGVGSRTSASFSSESPAFSPGKGETVSWPVMTTYREGGVLCQGIPRLYRLVSRDGYDHCSLTVKPLMLARLNVELH